MKRFEIVLLISCGCIWLAPGSYAADEFYGVIESRPEAKVGTWVIGGRQVAVTEKTELEEDEGPLAVGVCAEVEYEGTVVDEIESEKLHKCGKPAQ